MSKKHTKQSKKKTAKKAVKKNRQVVITSPVNPDIKIVVASEMADDSLIESELMGEVLPFFVYQFQADGKPVSGLTVKGVSEVVRRLNRNTKSGYKIRINPDHLVIERDIEYNSEKGVEVRVFAEDLVTGNSGWGVKFEPYFKAGRKGRYANTFALEKALSKAERNAKKKLIPEQVAVKMIQKMMTEGNGQHVKQLEAPTEPTYVQVMPSKPKMSTTEEIQSVILQAIDQAKSVEAVIDLDEKTQDSEKFSKQFKEAVKVAANNKVSRLENANK